MLEVTSGNRILAQRPVLTDSFNSCPQLQGIEYTRNDELRNSRQSLKSFVFYGTLGRIFAPKRVELAILVNTFGDECVFSC